MGTHIRDGFAHIDARGTPRLFGITREQVIMSLAAERGVAITNDTDFDRAETAILAAGEAITPATSILKWDGKA